MKERRCLHKPSCESMRACRDLYAAQLEILLAAVKRLYVAAEVRATTPDGIIAEQEANGAALVALFQLAKLCPAP